MKHLLLFIITITAVSINSSAQTDLEIADLFGGKYADDPRATEIEMTGGRLRDYSLSVYRSLTLVDAPEAAVTIEALLREDGADATQREVNYRDGGIYYAFYQLPKVDKENRYIFYLNLTRTGGKKIMLVYVAGRADSSQIKKLLNINDKKK